MPFSPTDYSNLWTWLKSGAGITKTGSSVTAWADQSGNGHDLTASSGQEPIFQSAVLNGYGALSNNSGFTAVMATAANFPDIHAGGVIYLVASQKADASAANFDSAGVFIGAGNTSDFQIYRGSLTGTLAIKGGIGTASGNTIQLAADDNTFYTIRLRSDGTNIYLSLNNGTEVTAAMSGASYIATPLTLLKTLGGAKGDKQIVEVLAYTANHTSDQQAHIEYYLQQKYNHYTWTDTIPYTTSSNNSNSITMATVNSFQNATTSKNTGLTTTQFDPRNIVGGLIVPKGYTIVAADLATLQDKLLGDICNNSKLARIYPIANFLEHKDGSEKRVTQQFSYGSTKTVRDGAYNWAFQFTKGGHGLLQALRAFNGDAWDYLFVDAKNTLIGQIFFDPSTGAKGVRAIPSLDFYAEPFGNNDGKKVAEYMVNFSFFPQYVNENVGYITDAGFNLLDILKGLVDVNISVVGTATPGTYRATLTDNLGVNLFGTIANLTGSGKTNWAVANALSGVGIALTSATANSAALAFDLVVPTGDAAYPAGTGSDTKLSFNLVGPTALNTANVGLYESAGPFLVTKN